MQKFSIKSFSCARMATVLLAVFLCFPGVSLAQSNYTPSELDTLVSNIALYPDPLLVHVLTASTYGEQIPAASAWAQGHKHLKGESLAEAMEQANLSYDPSVQALLPFPTVLEMLAKYRAWCDQLGDAVTNQKDDVMDAVQRMRQSAYDHGHLQSDERVQVAETSGNITIEPVKTEVVYVPVYNPRVVYYVYADGYTRITYGSGVWLGAWYGEWGWGSCWFDWGPRVIYVRNTRWYAHRPIPHHPHRYRPPPRHGPGPGPGMAPRHDPPPAARRTAAPAPRMTTQSAPHAAPSNHLSVGQPHHTTQVPARATPAPAPRESTGPRLAPSSRVTVEPSPSSQARAQRFYYNDDEDEQQTTFGNVGRKTSNSSNGSSARSSGNGKSSHSSINSNRTSGGSRSNGGGFGKSVKRR